MEKYTISENYYYAKTRDRLGGTIRTDVFKKDGLFQAFSSYRRDEDGEIVGYAESDDDEYAVMLSRKILRKEWKEYLEQKAIGNEPKSRFTLYMANGEIINS